MIKVYDFYCPNCGWEDEVFCDSGEYGHTCPECASVATAKISAPRVAWLKMGADPSFPSAADKWVKDKARRKAWERKHDRKDSGEL